MVDRQLQKYKLLEEVGQGGMAVVYRGIDTSLNREVAVKILHPHLAKEEESKRRFQREAQAVAKLRHDNILQIYDYSGATSADSYIVTEFIHGETLREFLAHNPISHPEVAAMIIHEVCRALAHAHSLSVIHRDIKPENIMIRRDGRVKLMDFGIAQMVDMHKLTVTGQLLGSPAYMSPELVQGGQLDFRSDVFSVGTLLYQLATSQMPFKGKNPHETLKRIADGQYLSPELVNPVVDSELGGIIHKALAHSPDDRYTQVDDLMVDLRTYLAKVGIEDPCAELARYFQAPPDYSRGLQKKLITALTVRGNAELEAGRKARALQYFDRLLCLDPSNADALTTLRRISRQRRWVRIGVLAAGVVCATAALLVIGAHWPPPSAKQSSRANSGASNAGAGAAKRPGTGAVGGAVALPTTGADTGAAHDLAVAGDGLVGADVSPDAGSAAAPPDAQSEPRLSTKRGARATSRRRARARRASSARTPAPRPNRPAVDIPSPAPARRLEISPRPKAVTIWLNGKRLGNYGPDLRFLDLPPGLNTLMLRNDACCFQKVVTIGPRQDPKRLAVRLPWKPGRVRVKVTPDVKADVVVGSLVARGGQTVEVPIPDYSSSGRAGVQVTVSASGYLTESRTVTVRANTLTTLTLNLRRLP